MNPKIKKITEGEMVVWGTFLAGLDGLCALFVLITAGVGEAVTIPTQGFISFWMMQWFKGKGADTSKLGQQILKYFCSSLLPAGNFGVFVVSTIIHNKLSNGSFVGKTITK